MAVVVADGARAGGVGEARRPRPDARHLMPAGVGVALVQPIWSVRRHRPPAGIVSHRARRADVVVARLVELNPAGRPAGLRREMAVVVGRPGRLTLATRPVVREEHDDRVLPLPHVLQHAPQAPDVLVDTVDHRGVDRHIAGVQALVSGIERVPRPGLIARFVIAGRQRGPRWDHAQLDLTGMTTGANLVPSDGVDIVVFGNVLGHGHQRRVGRRMCGVEEERLARSCCLARTDHRDRLVGEIVGEVIAVGISVGVDQMVVGEQGMGLVQVGERLEVAVVPLESPLTRPRVHRSIGRHVGVSGEVPLTDHQRGVAMVTQHLRGRGHIGGEFAAIARIPGVVLGNMPHPRGMGVDAGE